MIRFENVSFAYGQKQVIKELSFSVSDGEILAVMGPSGCGKTTLLQLAAGLRKPQSGTVTTNAERISYVFQEPRLFPWLTVEENIGYGLRIKHVDPAIIKERVANVMEIVGLTKYANYYPRQLSASMLQRVVIARAFAVEPELLLMDEPYGQLDLQLKYHLEDELLNLWKKTGTTVIFITHNIEEAVYLSDRILVLTNKPTKIKQSLPNNLPRPRKVSDPDFIKLRNEVTDLIKWW